MTTIPADPQPGERYAVRNVCGWDVCVRRPDNSDGEPTFVVIACGLSEANARLLVYGERVRSWLEYIRDMATERGQTQIAVHTQMLLERLEGK